MPDICHSGCPIDDVAPVDGHDLRSHELMISAAMVSAPANKTIKVKLSIISPQNGY
jgi:hypothetical protein